MRLDECFERVYVLNLPFKKDRRRRLVRHLHESGIVDTRRVVWTDGVLISMIGGLSAGHIVAH